jgi:hypothetical protein
VGRLQITHQPEQNTQMNQDTCNICGGSLEEGFCRDPIIFGKHPGPICFACFTVPAQPPDWQRGKGRPDLGGLQMSCHLLPDASCLPPA